MKNQKMKETLRQISKKTGALVLATAIVLGGGTYVYNQQNPVPELVTYVDDNGVVEIEEDETPLASPKVTKSTKTTKSTKKISLKAASARTYTQKGKTTTKKKTTKTKTSSKTVTTETTTQTSVTNNYKKGSKINTQVTTVKTTVQKTETAIVTGQPTQTNVGNGTIAITQVAPAADKRVLNAFQKLGFQTVINSSVPYSGECNTRNRTLTLKKADATVYHELGHFLAFVAGNVDTTPAFQQIFANEKSKYTAFDKGYVLQNSSEYFAQSFQNYTENPAALKASRPQTYAAIQQALSNVTDARVANLLKVYGAIWNK